MTASQHSFPNPSPISERDPEFKLSPSNAPLVAPDGLRIRDLIKSERNLINSLQGHLEPAQQQVMAARQRVQKLENELLSARTVLAYAVGNVERLEDQIKGLEIGIKEKLAHVHPIRILPVELLQYIFELRVQDEESERRAYFLPSFNQYPVTPFRFSPSHSIKRYCPMKAALRIALVCKNWREVAHSTPALWRFIIWPLNGQPDTNLYDRFREFQRRAKGLPLELSCPGWHDGSYPPPIHQLDKAFRVLTDFNEDGSYNQDALPDVTCKLKRLEIVFDTMNERPESLPINIHWHAHWPKPDELVLVRMAGSSRRQRGQSNMVVSPGSISNAVVGAYMGGGHHWGVMNPSPFPGLLSTPIYCKSLMPFVTSATLSNIAYDWNAVSDPHPNLKELTLVITRSLLLYESFLHHGQGQSTPQNVWNCMKAAPNLQKLSISSTVPTNSPSALPRNPQMAPLRHEYLTHLQLSLHDFAHFLPLDNTNPNPMVPAPPALSLPALIRLTITQATPDPDIETYRKIESLLDMDPELSLKKVRELEFWNIEKDSPIISKEDESRTIVSDIFLSILGLFDGCQLLDLRGSAAEAILNGLVFDTAGITPTVDDSPRRMTERKRVEPWKKLPLLSKLVLRKSPRLRGSVVRTFVKERREDINGHKMAKLEELEVLECPLVTPEHWSGMDLGW